MPSLDSLVAAHGPVLLIDSASSCVQVGLLGASAGAGWRQSTREAGIAIFEGVASLLTDARVELRDIGAFVFCDGPGSILGIRTAAMALRTWRATMARAAATLAYRSLQLEAQDLTAAGTPLPFAVVADARREAWHRVEGSAGASVHPVERVSAAELAEYPGALFIPAGFRAWSRAPRSAQSVPYVVADLWARQGGADLLTDAAEPDAFLHHDAVYTPWTPRVHRAPPARTS